MARQDYLPLDEVINHFFDQETVQYSPIHADWRQGDW